MPTTRLLLPSITGVICRFTRSLAVLTVITLASTAQAQPGEVVDDAGRTVMVPGDPSRVFSGGDFAFTQILAELDIPIIGSIASYDRTTGQSFVHGFANTRGEYLEDTAAALFTDQVVPSIEDLAALEPDLIIAPLFGGQDILHQLEVVAPTYLVGHSTAPWVMYESIARAVHRTEAYERRRAIFEERLELTRERLGVPAGTTYALVTIEATGALSPHDLPTYTHILEGLGLEPNPLMREMRTLRTYAPLSYERFTDLEADFIFAPFRERSYKLLGQAADNLNRNLPMWCHLLEACRDGRMIFFSEDVALSGTFTALNSFLEIAQSHLATRFIPGGPGVGEP
ncbi:hypothetical protein [Algihabitans sp.]|uniref:hypothetical protein n=1 Tax=Algihabitans sp. TaxID=2821514 RepID=UPI003BA86923